MNLLNIAITAAVIAGEEIKNIYDSGDFDLTFKADHSPLTKADRAAHDKIVEILSQTNLPILSEEGKEIEYSQRRAWETFWMVDPLDGTKEFVKKNGEFTVNIALINNGKPVLGVVYTPTCSELYYGELNTGAYKTKVGSFDVDDDVHLEKVVRLPSVTTSQYTIVASRSHMSKETQDIILKKELEHGEVSVVSKGSSLKLCLVAEGKANYYPRLAPTMEWDTAAGHAVALAAGCAVLQFDTKDPLVYNKENLLNPWFEVIGER